MWVVKARRIGDKRFSFLTPAGAMNRLRIHAAMFPDLKKAKQVAGELRELNPSHEFKVSPARAIS